MSESVARRARFIAASVFAIAAAFVLAKTGRDALFVQEQGLFDLPKAYIGIALLSGPLAFAILALLRRFGPRTVRVALPLATALSMTAFAFVVRPGGGALMTFFFMFVPLIWGVVFSVAWLLASDLLDGADATETARGYSLIGGAAIGGGVAAGALARVIAPHVEPQVLLWLAALALVVSSAIMAEAHRRFPPAFAGPDPDAEALPEQARAAPRPIWSSSYVRALLSVGMAAAVVGVLVEFRFYLAAAASGGEGRDQAEFFATFYLTLNLGALVIQLWVLPRILHRVGLGGALLILPVALVGGAAALAASVSLAVAAAVRVTEGGLKSSIHRTSWEQAYLPLAVADRPRTRVFVDGLATRVAEGMAGGLLLLWLHVIVADAGVTEGATRWITALMVLAVAAWLAATEWLGRELRRSGRRRPGPGVYLPLRLPDG